MTSRPSREEDELQMSASLNASHPKLRFVFAIIGQGLFSLGRFITTMVIGGRFNLNNVQTGAGSEAELGHYLAFFSVLLFGLGILEAFVTTPMTYLIHGRKDEQKPQFATLLLLICFAISVLFFGFVLLAGVLAQTRFLDLSTLALVAFAFLMATQFVREFLIRWLLAHLKTSQYVAYELAYFLFFALAIALTTQSQQISLTTIFTITAISNLLLIGIVWWQQRFEFASFKSTIQQTGLLQLLSKATDSESQNAQSELWPEFVATLKEQVYFGRWLAADSICAVMTIYFFNWLLLFKIDAAAAGIYGACMTIVLLANPLLNGAMSAFAPTAAIEYQESGKTGLNRILWRFGTGLVVVMLLFVAVLWFAGGPLTKLLYGASYDQFFEQHYSGENRIPFLLGLSMPLNAAAYLLACSLMACGQPKYNFYSSFAGLAAVVGLGTIMQEPNLVSCALYFSISIGVVLAFRSYFYWVCRGEPKPAKG